MEKDTELHLRIPRKLKKILTIKATESKRTLSDFIRIILEKFVDSGK